MNLKSKFGSLFDSIMVYMITFGYSIIIGITVIAWIFFQEKSSCSDRCVMTLQSWLLGFAIVSTICIVCVSLFLIFSSKIDVNIGVILYIGLGIAFAIFFFMYHWFVYDGLFGSRSTCFTTARPLWIATMTIVIMQLVSIPCIGMFMLVTWKLHKFKKSLSDSDSGGQPAKPVQESNSSGNQPTNSEMVPIEV